MFQSTSAVALVDVQDDRGKAKAPHQCQFAVCESSESCLGTEFHDPKVIHGVFLWDNKEHKQVSVAQSRWLKHLRKQQSLGRMNQATIKQLKVCQKTAKHLRRGMQNIKLSLLNGHCCFCHADVLAVNQVDHRLYSDLHEFTMKNDKSLLALLECCKNDKHADQLMAPLVEDDEFN